jgi:hypothetical protein
VNVSEPNITTNICIITIANGREVKTAIKPPPILENIIDLPSCLVNLIVCFNFFLKKK